MSEKQTQKAVKYTLFGSKREHCSICEAWLGSNSCSKVQGHIISHGWCELFEKRAKGNLLTSAA